MYYFVINFLLISSASLFAMAPEQKTGENQKSPRTCEIKGRTGSYTIAFPEEDQYQKPISADLTAVIACIAVGDWDALRKDTERLKRLEHGELETAQGHCAHRQSAIEATADLWSNSTIEEYVRALQMQFAAMPEDKVESMEFPALGEIRSCIPKIDRVKSAQKRRWQETGPLSDDHESALGIFDLLGRSRATLHIATLLQSLATKNDDEAVAYILQETEEVAATITFLRIIKKEEWMKPQHVGRRYAASRRRNASDAQADQEAPASTAMQQGDDDVRLRAKNLEHMVDGDVPSLEWLMEYFGGKLPDEVEE